MYRSAWNCCAFPISNATMAPAKSSRALSGVLTTANASACRPERRAENRRSCACWPASRRRSAARSYARRDAKLGYLAQGVADETRGDAAGAHRCGAGAGAARRVGAAQQNAAHDAGGVRLRTNRVRSSATLVFGRPAGESSANAPAHRRAGLPDSRRADEPSRRRNDSLARIVRRRTIHAATSSSRTIAIFSTG